MTPSTSLSLTTEIAIILRAQIPQYLPGTRTAEAFEEAAKICEREEHARKLLKRWERWATAHGHDVGMRDDTRDFLANGQHEPTAEKA